jgi:hypothetical protein
MKNLIIAFEVVFLFSACSNISKETSMYFKSGEISSRIEVDTSHIRYYSTILRSLNEAPLRSNLTGVEAFRLVVRDPIYNPIVIHVQHIDSLTSVSFKVVGDEPGRERLGLSGLTLAFKSSSERMDSLYKILIESVRRYDFYNAIDDPKDYEIADGTSYLLESYYNDVYKVVPAVGVGIGSGPPFKGSKEFFRIVNCLLAFAPKQILPNLDSAQTIEDVIFPILRRDTL